jgi:uncharacterized protein YndB with AHSA1/START domain
MSSETRTGITVEVSVRAPISKVWSMWTESQHITEWYHASEEWHVPYAENDLRVGGAFTTRMAAKDGSVSFDFTGVYTKVVQNSRVDYIIPDGRKVSVTFEETPDGVKVTESFEAESINSIEQQRAGWQAILDNFKKYSEENL